MEDLGHPELSPDDRHHLAAALRLRPGDPLTVSDAAGSWLPCVFGEVLEPVGEAVCVPQPTLPVTVGFAPIKGGRVEMVVQKLTELGVDTILLLLAERSVVRWSAERAARQVARLKRVAREASMQSRRVYLPEVDGPVGLEEVADGPGVAMAEPGGPPLDADRTTLLVGPEGGWTRAELGSRATVGLGPTVLRSETAAIAAATLLTAQRGRLG